MTVGGIPPDHAMGPAGPLALIELLDRDGSVRQAWPVLAWPIGVGRAIDNTVVLDDPAVAAHHLRLEAPEAGSTAPRLRALPSVNGTQMGRQRLPVDAPVAWTGSQLRIGHSQLRLRLRGESLAPERPLAPVVRGLPTAGLLLLVMLWALASQWIAADPGDRWADQLPLLLGWPLAIAAWTAAWALMSRLFQRRSDFLQHAGIALRYLLAVLGVEQGLPIVAGILGWPWLSHVAPALGVVVGTLGLLAHARVVWPGATRWMAVGATAALATLAVMTVAMNLQSQDRWFSSLYLTALPPADLNLRRSVDLDTFLEDAAELKDQVDERVRDTADDLAREPEDGSSPQE